jgi:hypothetical protein
MYVLPRQGPWQRRQICFLKDNPQVVVVVVVGVVVGLFCFGFCRRRRRSSSSSSSSSYSYSSSSRSSTTLREFCLFNYPFPLISILWEFLPALDLHHF